MDKKNRTKLLINVAIILAVAFFAVLVFRVILKVGMGNRKGEGAVYNVGTIALKKEKVDLVLTLQGTIEGDPQVRVYSPVDGKFLKNSVREGEIVRQDQPICYINRDIVGSEYRPAPVNSPINGMVIRLYYMDKGTPVVINNPVADVANPNKIKVVLNVGEEDLLKVAVNQKALIYSIMDNTRNLDAIVDSVTPYINIDTQTGKITIKAENPGNILKIGMSAGVTITTGSRISFMVPNEAVVMGMNRATVFLAVKEKAKLVEVKTGYSAGGKTEILSDQLQEGDVLVTVGSFKLFDGASIKTGNAKVE
jgi:multidrug efflux pump subunit AcrA (membrane-fusion protein)